MPQYILGSGLIQKRMERAFKFGRMGQYMRGFGLMIKHMEEDVCIMLTVISMKEYIKHIYNFRNGLITKLRVSAFIIIKMELNMRDNGMMISKMAMAQRHGLMEPNLKANTRMVKSMALEDLLGAMELGSQGTS